MPHSPKTRLDAEPGIAKTLDPKHVQALYRALQSAGLGGFTIAKLQLTPSVESVAPDCQAVKQADGTWHIECK